MTAATIAILGVVAFAFTEFDLIVFEAKQTLVIIANNPNIKNNLFIFLLCVENSKFIYKMTVLV